MSRARRPVKQPGIDDQLPESYLQKINVMRSIVRFFRSSRADYSMKHSLVSPSNYPISAFNDLLNLWRSTMNNDSSSNRPLPGHDHPGNPGKPFVEEPYAVNEYAYMYYMMTPFGTSQANREKPLGK
jgi:hypothetical protein